MIPDYVSLAYRVTYWHDPREDKLVSNLARKYTGSMIFTVCIVYTTVCSRLSLCANIFTLVVLEKYLGATWWLCYNGFVSNRTALFWLFLNTFYQLWGVVLYMLLGLFANIFVQFWVRLKHECVLYQACTVFVEVTYFLANEKKTYFSWPCVGCRGTTED